MHLQSALTQRMDDLAEGFLLLIDDVVSVVLFEGGLGGQGIGVHERIGLDRIFNLINQVLPRPCGATMRH